MVSNTIMTYKMKFKKDGKIDMPELPSYGLTLKTRILFDLNLKVTKEIQQSAEPVIGLYG